MKAYVLTTGVVFGLVAIAHLLRVMHEGRHVGHDPWFLLITLVAAAFCAWAFRLVWLARARQPRQQ